MTSRICPGRRPRPRVSGARFVARQQRRIRRRPPLTGEFAGAEADGFATDLYGGYAGSIRKLDYRVGFIKYLYLNVDESDLLEFAGSVGVGPVRLGIDQGDAVVLAVTWDFAMSR